MIAVGQVYKNKNFYPLTNGYYYIRIDRIEKNHIEYSFKSVHTLKWVGGNITTASRLEENYELYEGEIDE